VQQNIMSTLRTRIAGIDYGTKRIGVALADEAVGIATPHSTCHRQGEDADRRFFLDLVANEGIDRFIVGLPVHLDGHESQKSFEARQFGEWLHAVTNVPVEFFDERFTTVEADAILNATPLTKKRRMLRRDQLAAQIMLSAYLESGGASGPPLSIE
jgi:putative Holliday junction resolvase